MAGTIWIPGAERITPSAPGGTMSGGKPRVTWHTTEADPGTASVWAAMIRVLKGKSAEPQVLYDPLTDRLGQFIPLSLSGRALRNDGTLRTNRTGLVNIQIEVIGRSAKPFTSYWKPGKNFRALMAAIRSWGIPDDWPAGDPPRFIADPPHNVPESPRFRTLWLGHAGHYGHSQVPGNDHGDPGGISTAALFRAGAGTTTPPPATTTPKELFTVSQFDELMQEQKRQGDATRKEVREQAIWGLRYGVEIADNLERAGQRMADALKAGKSIDEAQAEFTAEVSSIRADLVKRAADNEAGKV